MNGWKEETAVNRLLTQAFGSICV